jgi:uncharacterized membrane protein
LPASDRQYDRGAGALPDGLILSSIVVGIALFTGWMGGETVFRHRVAVYAARGLTANPVRR